MSANQIPPTAHDHGNLCCDQIEAENAALRAERDDALSSPMAAGLLLALKQECEAQHARAEAAESRLAAVEEALRLEKERFAARTWPYTQEEKDLAAKQAVRARLTPTVK